MPAVAAHKSEFCRRRRHHPERWRRYGAETERARVLKGRFALYEGLPIDVFDLSANAVEVKTAVVAMAEAWVEATEEEE